MLRNYGPAIAYIANLILAMLSINKRVNLIGDVINNIVNFNDLIM